MLHARDDYKRIQDPAGIIPADEPVMLFRAQDALAADLVREYARRVSVRRGDPEIVRLSLLQADRMDAWPVKKMPDITPQAVPTVGHNPTMIEQEKDFQ